MELNDWLLALHLLSAFSLVAAMIVFWVAIVVIRRTDLPEQVVAAGRSSRSPDVAVTVGALGTIIFGVWLAISLDGVAVWSGWVIAAIILWAIGTETGRRGGTVLRGVHRPREGARRGRADRPRREARRARALAAGPDAAHGRVRSRSC